MRTSITAAPSWSRSPFTRRAAGAMRLPPTNVPFEEFRSFTTASPRSNVRRACERETDSCSTVDVRLRPSVTVRELDLVAFGRENVMPDVFRHCV